MATRKRTEGFQPVSKPKRSKQPDIPAAETLVLAALPVALAPQPVFRDAEDIRKAVEHVTSVDPLLAALIEEHGQPTKLLKQQGIPTFQALAKIVIFQQLHGKAAEAIYQRVLTACKDPLLPASVLSAPRADLRACGLSERKAEYLTCLAERFTNEQLEESDILTMSDQDLKDSLTQVKGIGPWSVDMLLMFNLGRVNVLPVGDLAVRKGMQALYGLREPPSPAQMEAVARKWEPYRSIGTYLMWRVPTPKASPKAKAARSPVKGK